METFYKRIEIKGAESLPGDGDYLVHLKNIGLIETAIIERGSSLKALKPEWWLNNVDWYLLPISEEEYQRQVQFEAACYSELMEARITNTLFTERIKILKEGVITAVDKVYEEWLTDGNSRQTLGEVIADALCSEPEGRTQGNEGQEDKVIHTNN